MRIEAGANVDQARVRQVLALVENGTRYFLFSWRPLSGLSMRARQDSSAKTALDWPWGRRDTRKQGGTAVHPGITMHKIPVKGPVGLVFALGVVVIALLSLPEARWFLAVSLPIGVAIGIILRLTSRD